MGTVNPREVRESPVEQALDESIAYLFDFTKWGTPANPQVKIYNGRGEDVSANHLTGQ
jgi:hypothetical protein